MCRFCPHCLFPQQPRKRSVGEIRKAFSTNHLGRKKRLVVPHPMGNNIGEQSPPAAKPALVRPRMRDLPKLDAAGELGNECYFPRLRFYLNKHF